MKKIAADRNYRMLKRAEVHVTRETLVPMALRLAEEDGWTYWGVAEDTGEDVYHQDRGGSDDRPSRGFSRDQKLVSIDDLIEMYHERAKREYFKDEANKEAERSLSYPGDVPLEGPWSDEDIERVARWNRKYSYNMCPSCGKSLAKWKEAVKADALRNGRIFIAANN